jgi:hypothetical protein
MNPSKTNPTRSVNTYTDSDYIAYTDGDNDNEYTTLKSITLTNSLLTPVVISAAINDTLDFSTVNNVYGIFERRYKADSEKIENLNR